MPKYIVRGTAATSREEIEASLAEQPVEVLESYHRRGGGWTFLVQAEERPTLPPGIAVYEDYPVEVPSVQHEIGDESS